jgi:hypothetical protein|tara:strand:- start:5299 stop:6306 length:1008 start_codon:yes stop_codon:yes gene_type:complete
MKEEDRNTRASQDDSIVSLMRLAGPRESLPQDVKARLEESFREELRKSKQRRTVRNLAGLSAAAAVLLLAVMLTLPSEQQPSTVVASVVRMTGAVLLNSDGSGSDIGSGIAVGTRVRTGTDGRLLLSFGTGGTTVRLDHATELILQSESQLFLNSGSIYIDTGGDSQTQSHLTVSTAFADITDVGTQYLISSASSSTTVTVREGVVRVVTDDQQMEGHAMPDAAQQLSISNTRMVTSSSIAKHGGSWSWIHSIAPGFDTDKRHPIDFLNWVSRETGRPLRFASGASERAANEGVLTGSIHRLEIPPLEAMRETLKTTALQSIPSEDGTILIALRR